MRLRIAVIVAVAVALAGGVLAARVVEGAGAPPQEPDRPVADGAARAPSPVGPSVSPSPAATGGLLVIWARGDLTAPFADAVARLDGVSAAAHVRSSTLGLVAARTAAGEVAEDLADGYRIPMSVTAVDPAAYAQVLTGRTGAAAVASLAPGRVLLTESAAELRGIGIGGELDLATLAGLEVVGLVPDGTVGRAEIVIHEADATAAGIDEDGTVYVRHTRGEGPPTEELVERIEALVPADLAARIVGAGVSDGERRGPLVLSLPEVKARFGEFAFRPRDGVREIEVDPSFTSEHIVTVAVPLLGRVTCHEGIIADLRAALDAIVEAGLSHEIDANRYAGCYYPRRISVSGDRLSHHSWGIALDINVDLSLPGLGPPPHPDVVAAFEAHGFRWGGDFLQPDNHHFEWVGEVAPVDRG